MPREGGRTDGQPRQALFPPLPQPLPPTASFSVLPTSHAPLRAHSAFPAHLAPGSHVCACAAPRPPPAPFSAAVVGGAGRTVTFLRSYWPPAGPGRVRAHPRPRLPPPLPGGSFRLCQRRRGCRPPVLPPAPRPSQPPRCRRHRCAGGGLPRAGEGAAAVRAAAAAAVLPLRYVGGGWFCFTPFPSPARLRGPQRGVAPRARQGGGRSVCLPARPTGRSVAGRPCRGRLRGDGTTGPGGLGACAVGAPRRLLLSRLGLTGRVVNGEDRGGGQANGGLSDLSGSRCRGEVKRRWRRSALAAPFRVTSNFPRQGQRDLPASWRRSGGGGGGG